MISYKWKKKYQRWHLFDRFEAFLKLLSTCTQTLPLIWPRLCDEITVLTIHTLQVFRDLLPYDIESIWNSGIAYCLLLILFILCVLYTIRLVLVIFPHTHREWWKRFLYRMAYILNLLTLLWTQLIVLYVPQYNQMALIWGFILFLYTFHLLYIAYIISEHIYRLIVFPVVPEPMKTWKRFCWLIISAFIYLGLFCYILNCYEFECYSFIEIEIGNYHNKASFIQANVIQNWRYYYSKVLHIILIITFTVFPIRIWYKVISRYTRDYRTLLTIRWMRYSMLTSVVVFLFIFNWTLSGVTAYFFSLYVIMLIYNLRAAYNAELDL